ncbi:MAG: hypothetical protein H7328_04165 [Bdellovibrio sp.]|nr:hypothetical protein [Bdellovibrio sp.]
MTSTDVTTALTFTPVPNTLTSANIFVGNASNVATGVVLSGDATISNAGILALSPVSAGGTFPKVTFNTKGLVTSGSALTSTDITTGLGYTPSSNTLTSANIFVGNASNLAVGVVLSGDATISNAGILALSPVSAGGTFPKVTFNTKGLVTSGSALTSTDVTTGLGYTPSSNTLTSANIFVGNVSNVATGVVLSGDASISNAGVLTINNNAITNVKINDVAFSKLTSKPTTITGYGIVMTSTDVTGALGYTPGTGSGSVTGVTSASTSGNPITVSNSSTSPSIDISRATASVNGYLASSDFTAFNSKLGTSLNSAQLFIGNASNLAVGVVLSGDASISNAGILALSPVSAGGTFPKVTFNTKGLVTSGSALTSTDVTTGLGYTPSSNTLTSANIFVGNASNVATGVVLSGDATISNAGVLTINNNAITNVKINDVAFSKLTAKPTTITGYGIVMTSTDVTTALTFTPASNTLTSANIFVGNASNVAQGQVLSGDASISNAGVLTINNNAITNVKINDVAFSKLTAKPTTITGYGIVMTSTDVTTALTFTPVPNTLTSANIFVGNATNIAQGQVLSGDASISNTGILTLSNSGVGAGTFSKVTVDTKGRVTAASLINSTDVTTALTFTPVPNTLTSANIFVGNASNIAQSVVLSGDATIANTGVLTLNTVSIAKGGTGATAKTAAFDNLAPTTTKGDLIVSNGINNVRLPAGTNNQTLIADSTQPSGVKWINNGVVDRNMSAVPVTNTVTETAIYSYTVPAGMLGTQSGLKLNLIGTYLNNSGANKTVRIRVKYGANVLFDDTSLNFATAATTRSYNLNIDLFNAGATNSQKMGGLSSFSNSAAPVAGVGDFTVTNVLNSIIYGTAATDSTLAQVLTVTVVHSVAATTVTMTNQMASLQFLY